MKEWKERNSKTEREKEREKGLIVFVIRIESHRIEYKQQWQALGGLFCLFRFKFDNSRRIPHHF